MKFINTTGISNSLSMEESSSMTKRLQQQRGLDLEKARAKRVQAKVNAEERYKAAKQRQIDREIAERKKSLRLWKAVQRKIRYEPPQPGYYEVSPLKPGIAFFAQLLMHPKISASGLPIRIPEMLLVNNSVAWVRTQETAAGPQLHILKEFRLIEFHLGFSRALGKQPIAVLRLPDDHIEDMTALPLNFEDLSSHLNASQLPHNGLIQRYVHCHADKLEVTRLFYYVQSKANISSYAYALTATKSAEHLFNGQWILRTDQIGAVDVFPVAGAALKRGIADAQVVVEFLQKAFSVRIECIVLDFLKDAMDCMWLLSCKGIQVDLTSVLSKEIKENTEEQRREMQGEQKSSIHCKMCLMPYQPSEVAHLLPFKMLLLFKHHTSHSGRRPFDLSHLRVNTIDFLSHWVRLCEICYLLVIHEYELMETERRLANLLNIPAKEPDVMNEPLIDQPSFLPARLSQWRVLLYFSELEFKEESTDRSGLYLQYSLFGDKFCYLLEPRWLSGSRARYHLTRLYYFFSENNGDVRKFAESCESHFRLTRGKEWEHVVAEGACRPFTSFTCEMDNNEALCQPLEVLLFRDDSLYITAHLTVGITRDREVNLREMPVSIYRQHGIFVPEQSYINSEPLPSAWMEVFTKQYKGLDRTELVDSSEEIEEMYTPKLNRKEIYSRPMVSTHVMHTNIDLDPFPRPPRPTQSAKTRTPLYLSATSPKSQVSATPKLAKSRPHHLSHPSLSTTASSKVLYQLDVGSKLKSPTFLSPRPSLAFPKFTEPHEVLTNESIEELKELFGEDKKAEEVVTSGESLKDTVSHFLQRRTQSQDFEVLQSPGRKRKARRVKPMHKTMHSKQQRQLSAVYSQQFLY